MSLRPSTTTETAGLAWRSMTKARTRFSSFFRSISMASFWASTCTLPLRSAGPPPSVGGPSKMGRAPVPPVPEKCMAQRIDSVACTTRLLSTRETAYITTKKAKRRVMKSA